MFHDVPPSEKQRKRKKGVGERGGLQTQAKSVQREKIYINSASLQKGGPSAADESFFRADKSVASRNVARPPGLRPILAIKTASRASAQFLTSRSGTRRSCARVLCSRLLSLRSPLWRLPQDRSLNKRRPEGGTLAAVARPWIWKAGAE